MTYLRHASRHVHHTVANHLTARLTELGWLTAGSVPFDAPPLQIKRTAGPLKDVRSGEVRITLGDERAPDLEEMGGPLSTQDYPVFVDCFLDTEATCLALASDVRDVFLGRLGNRFIPVINQITSTPVEGWVIEFDDVERVRPESSMALHWQVVKVTAVTAFPETVFA